MANIKIIDLPTGSPESTSFIEATQVDELAESGRSTVKLALNALGNFVAGQDASPLEYGDLETESTTLIGAANELHNTIGADAYDDTATYNTGDYCIYGGELYKCNDDNVTGAWDATKWDATILVDELGGSGSSLVLPESIADEYDDTASYTAGDFVMYQGILYKCNHISATGSFDPTKWDAISATDYINSVKSSLNTNISQLAGDLSDAYSSSRTYAVGDLCILGNLLYKCNTAITTPEAWTPAHWTATTVKAELALKQNSTDNSLNTDDKTVVGAINELKSERTPKFIGSLICTSDATTGKVAIPFSVLGITSKPAAVIGVQEYNNGISLNIFYAFDETNSANGVILYFQNTTNYAIEKNRLMRFGLIVFEYGDVVD